MRSGKTSCSPVSRLTRGTPAGISGKYHLPKIGTRAALSLAVSRLCLPAQVSALASRTITCLLAVLSRGSCLDAIHGHRYEQDEKVDNRVEVQTAGCLAGRT